LFNPIGSTPPFNLGNQSSGSFRRHSCSPAWPKPKFSQPLESDWLLPSIFGLSLILFCPSFCFVETNVNGETIYCASTGCLCGLHPAYARINKWNHGFAIVEVDSKGVFQVDNQRVVDGKPWR
jgi:hypothetical protein